MSGIATVKCKREACGAEVAQNRPWQLFCSEACRTKYHNEMARRGRELMRVNALSVAGAST